jgi:hypothetical protein
MDPPEPYEDKPGYHHERRNNKRLHARGIILINARWSKYSARGLLCGRPGAFLPLRGNPY